MTTDELRAKFEAWWNFLLQTPNATAYSSGLPADGDYQGFSWLAFQAAHASRDAEVEALRKDAERYRWLKANDNAYLLSEDLIDDAIEVASYKIPDRKE